MFFNTTIASDATLVCNGTSFPVHRIILMARSDYFKALFLAPMREQDDLVARLDTEDIDATLLHAYLQLVYKNVIDEDDPISRDSNFIMHMLAYCCRFVSVHLGQLIEQHAIDLVTVDTVQIFLQVATTHSYTNLKVYCVFFISLLEKHGDVQFVNS
jgi:hypothetical protein